MVSLYPSKKGTHCRSFDRNEREEVFATGWVYTLTFTAHFIFTSNSKSFLEDSCLLTARGKTVSLGKCSGFGQSLQLLQQVRQALQCLTDKTLQPHEHDNYGGKKQPCSENDDSRLLSLTTPICQALCRTFCVPPPPPHTHSEKSREDKTVHRDRLITN